MNLEEVEEFVHNELLELFRSYLVVGGMPEIVSRFIETNNYDEVFNYQKDLLRTYVDDFGRNINTQNIVVRDNKLFERILSVYDSIPSQLAKENNKFQYALIKKGARASTYYDAIERLIGSGLIYKVKNLKNIESPLSFYKIDDQFKIYFADTGLLLQSYGKIIQDVLLSGNSGTFEGALYENLVCSLLIAKGLNPYYYQKNNRLEVDFVIETSKCPIVVEVKATNSKSKSLTTLISNPKNYGSDNIRCIKFYEKYLIDFINFEKLF